MCFIWIINFFLFLQPSLPESRKAGLRFETATSTASLFSVDEAELFNFSDEVSLFYLRLHKGIIVRIEASNCYIYIYIYTRKIQLEQKKSMF